MQALPFDKPGRFYRGNVHLHSTASDGGRSPDQVIADYRDRGYDFVSLTDHFLPNASFRPDEPGFITVTDTTALGDDGFATIPGAELHGPAMVNGEIWHVVAVGLPLDFAPLGEEESGLEVVRRAREAGAWLSLAHPHWNAVSDDDAMAIADLIDAVEVYNHASEVSLRRGWGMHTADTLLNRGRHVQLNAADDAHLRLAGPMTFIDGFGGWIQVKAEALTPESLLAAMKAGHYFSSTGPEIHDIRVADGRLHVETSPVNQIIVQGHGAWNRQAIGFNIIAGALELPQAEQGRWVRVSVVDGAGHMAWTNPFLLT